eukprot:sb/3462790/
MPYIEDPTQWGNFQKARRRSQIIPAIIAGPGVSGSLSAPTSPLASRSNRSAGSPLNRLRLEEGLSKITPKSTPLPRKQLTTPSKRDSVARRPGAPGPSGVSSEDDLQRTSFLWINAQLKRGKKTSVLADITTDVQSGVLLCELLEVVAERRLPHKKEPKSFFQRVDNLRTAFNVLKQDGVMLTSIGERDIGKGDVFATKALLWAVADFYMKRSTFIEDPEEDEGVQQPRKRRLTVSELERKGKDPEKLLITFLNKYLVPRIEPVTNLNTDWNSGIALSVLVDTCIPGFHDTFKTVEVSVRVEKCMLYAEDYLKVERVISVNDFTNPKVNKTAMIRYLSRFDKFLLNDTRIPLPLLEQEGMDPGVILKRTNLILRNYSLDPVKTWDREWRDGRLISILIDQQIPGFYQANMANPSAEERVKTCLKFSKVYLNIPVQLCWYSVFSKVYLNIPVQLCWYSVVYQSVPERALATFIGCFKEELPKLQFEKITELFDLPELLARINRRTQPCKITVKNLVEDWDDGIALLALLDSYIPGLYAKYQFTDNITRIKICLEVAEKQLGIGVSDVPLGGWVNGTLSLIHKQRFLSELVATRLQPRKISLNSIMTNVRKVYQRPEGSPKPQVRKELGSSSSDADQQAQITLAQAQARNLPSNHSLSTRSIER